MSNWNQVKNRITQRIGTRIERDHMKDIFAGYSLPPATKNGFEIKEFSWTAVVLRTPKLYKTYVNGEESYNSAITYLYGPGFPEDIFLELDEEGLVTAVKFVGSTAYQQRFG